MWGVRILLISRVRQRAAQNMFYDFTRDACQADWSLVFWRGFIMFLVHRRNKCHFPLHREDATYIRLRKNTSRILAHCGAKVFNTKGDIRSGPKALLGSSFCNCFSNPGMLIIRWPIWGYLLGGAGVDLRCLQEWKLIGSGAIPLLSVRWSLM